MLWSCLPIFGFICCRFESREHEAATCPKCTTNNEVPYNDVIRMVSKHNEYYLKPSSKVETLRVHVVDVRLVESRQLHTPFSPQWYFLALRLARRSCRS